MASNTTSHDTHDTQRPKADATAAAPDDPANSLSPDPSTYTRYRSLVISPNLHAALEYEERTRPGAYNNLGYSSGSPVAGGLPPPPRPKSRGKRAPSPSKSAASSAQNSPTVSLHSIGAGNADASSSNPYINPAPRLSFLLRENTLPVADPTSAPHEPLDDQHTNATTTRFRDDPPTSPRDPIPSPQTEPRRASTDLQRPNSRHNRYFSSLARVEKIFGKGKNALGVSSDPNTRNERRMSDAGLPEAGDAQETGSKDTVMRPYRRILDRGAKLTTPSQHHYALSAPNSPTNGFQSQSVASPSSRVASPTAIAGQAMVPRPLFSHARQASDMSMGSLSPDSESTHNPPSTITHTRISISSTIYSSNSRSFDDSHYRAQGRSSMSADRESFIDFASPSFSSSSSDIPHENGPSKLVVFPFSAPESSASYAKFSPNTETSSSSVKPVLPRLATTTTTTTATTTAITATPFAKPPLPTAPKPNFRRSRSAQPPTRRSHPPDDTARPTTLHISAADADRHFHGMPPTTNLLNPRERAELVRKTQKLTHLFGQTPGVALEMPGSDPVIDGCLPGNLSLNLTKRKHHKGTLSLSADTLLSGRNPASGQYTIPAVRGRPTLAHHEDNSTYSFSFPVNRSSEDSARPSRDVGHVIEIGSQKGDPSSDWDSHNGHGRPGRGVESPTSFIDLSDEEGAHDAISDHHPGQTPKIRRRRDRPLSPSSPSTPSLLSLSSEQQAEEERRRKRDKLAKLHRFLGSRVPAHLVLGTLDEGEPLPDPAPSPQGVMYEEIDTRKVRMPLRRRRSSSAAEFSATWSKDVERLKEDLNEREKAINVRRAVKMEKLFGVAPPQKLYHTRQPVLGPVSGASAVPGASGPPLSPSSPAFAAARGLSTSPRSSNINQSSYKPKWKKQARPGTAESSKPLITSEQDDILDPSQTLSDVYLHYRHSLNSLNDIIDRDDKQSLAELHDYLSGNQQDPLPQSPSSGMFTLVPPSAKADRRHSLPSRTSIISVASSEFSIATPTPEDSTFQARRRTAAKLTQFFGVNYRDLMNEILESIEKGLEDERGRGSLRPAEVQDLQQKLVNLKTKRDRFN